jgi:CubicO group peptidase (beta-lactamase class C family)
MIAATVTDDAVTADSSLAVPWWSFTKTVMAAAALVLVAQGRLRLDERLAGRWFTVRQLLQHRAGVANYGGLADYHTAVARRDDPWPVAELLERSGADRAIFEAGAGWAYSNIGYLFLRELIEAAAAASLDPALRRLVFAPLGIDGVSLARVPQDLDGTAWGNARGYDPGWVYHGLLIGPAASAALFLHRLLAGELLPAPLLDTMTTAHPVGGAVPGRPWRSAGYGLGLMIGEGEPKGVYLGHTGEGPGSVAAVYQQCPGRLRTAAVFAPLDEPGAVERQALALASGR